MKGWLSRGAGLLLATAGVVAAQSFPFQLLVTSATSSITVANDSAIPFTTPIGTSVTYHVVATYLPTNTSNTVTITNPPSILGNTQFSVTNFPSPLPVMLNPGDKLQFDITYKPTSANAATAQLSVNFVETSPPTGTSTTPVTTPNAIVLILDGSSPSFILSYVLQSSLNVVQLQPGGTIPFGGVPVNTTALAELNITNGGSGPGQVVGITPPPAGSPFKVTGIPLLPATVNAGVTLQLTIGYTPTASTTDNAQLQIQLDSGATLTVLLTGNGIAAAFAYQILTGSTPTPVTPPGPITLPDTSVGSTNSVNILVQNIGNASGVINNAPSISGPGFSVSAGVFPQTLKPGDSFQFSVNFTPTQPGVSKGNLIVGSDLFTVTGNGLGPQLTFSYNSAGTGSIPVINGGTVIFSPIPVTQSEQLTFVVMNAGTQTAHISNIGIGEANSPFSVSGLTLPITLAAGASAQFTVTFTPTTTGFSNGTLRIDTVVVNLTGSGTQPPPLPAFTIQGPSGNVAPQTQPSIGLTLASGYPVALAGTLTLTTNGTAVSDPAVQFSTGGTSVAFTIPANSTSANFAGHGSQIFLQTGTVAETIILTPEFQTQNGGIVLTPSPTPTLQFTVAPAAPTLLAATASGATATGFVLNVTGFSTIRSVDTLVVQFNAATGFNFGSNSQVSVDLHSTSAGWFQSAASQAFGGQFEISIPFTFTGTNLPTGTTAIQAIASVAVTVTNDVGTSNSLQVSLQ